MRLLPEPEDAAVEQPPARLHRRRHHRRRQVPVLRHRVPAQGGREGPRALIDRERARAVTRALVIAPQWIGDAVMAEPLLAALAERGERLDGGRAALGRAGLPRDAAGRRGRSSCRSRTAGSTGPRGAASRATLRGRFDVAYVLPNSLKSALLPWLARIPLRVGYRGEGRVAAAQPAPAESAGPAADGRVLRRARRRAVRRRASGRACSSTPRAARRGARARTACSAARYWAFAPGAEYGPAKRWPAAHYATLARSLHAADGAPIVLLGSPGEARAVRRDRRRSAAAPAASSPARRRCSTRWR